ncbi:MAG TPA: hypothetical protein VKR53_07170 [Puia sp.]|nr:hypothetical protein [Puia sp.]
MRNFYIKTIFYCMVFVHYICAMEITSQLCLRNNKPQIKTMDHIITMDRSGSAFTIFPKEIRDKIVRLMFNISDIVPVQLSIDNAVQYYLNIKQHCPLQVGNKTYSIEDLFTLDCQQRQELISMGNPSYLKKRLGFSHSLISNVDAQALASMPDDIRKDLEVTVFNPNLGTMFDLDARNSRKIVGGCGQGCMLMSFVEILTFSDLSLSSFQWLMPIGFTILCGMGLGTCYGCMKCNPACHQWVDTMREPRYDCKFKKKY